MHESLFISGESAWPLHGLNFANCEIAILCHLMLTKTRQPRKLKTKNTPVSIQVVKKKTAGVFCFFFFIEGKIFIKKQINNSQENFNTEDITKSVFCWTYPRTLIIAPEISHKKLKKGLQKKKKNS